MSEPAFEQKIGEGVALSQALSAVGIGLVQQLVETQSSSVKAESISKMAAKGFLVASSQLSGQIVIAVSGGSLSLAIIGLKTLLEYNVDADYIFAHPNHKGEQAWVDELCQDLLRRTNDLTEHKSRLGNVSVKQRMVAIGRKDLNEQNYAGLNDYAHLPLRQPFLNDRARFEKLSVTVVSHALCHLIGVIDAVDVFFSLGWEQRLKPEVISYRDRYEPVD